MKQSTLRLKSILILSISLLTATGAYAQRTLFVPDDYGTAFGYFPFGAFDDQPDLSDLSGTSNVVAIPGGSLGATISGLSGPGRAGYIDFGTDFASVQISELWSAYREFTNSSGSNYPSVAPFADIYWSDTSNNSAKAGGTFTDVDTSEFNFGTLETVSVAEDTVLWSQDFSFATAIVPERRYLILESGNPGFGHDRVTELAIVTTPIPEPSAYGLLAGVVALGAVARRRR